MPQLLYFPYYGPNRRSDRKVVELRLQFTADDVGQYPQRPEDVSSVLSAIGLVAAGDQFPGGELPDERPAWYTALLAQTALLLQHRSGHQVEFWSLLESSPGGRVSALVEHEDPATGMAAVNLAGQLFADPRRSTPDTVAQFQAAAGRRALPGETLAIIAALRRRDLPFLQLDREPLQGKVNTGQRIRPNGLLMTGQGVHVETLDGSFAVSRADGRSRALLSDPAQRRRIIIEHGMPLASGGSDSGE